MDLLLIAFLGAIFFVPSFIFWSSGIVKEAVVVGCFGFFCGGLYDFLSRRRVASLIVALLGVGGVAVVKPYVLFPLALAVGAWLNARRQRRGGWAMRVIAVVAALLAIVLLSKLFPAYGFDRLAESVAGQQVVPQVRGESRTVPAH